MFCGMNVMDRKKWSKQIPRMGLTWKITLWYVLLLLVTVLVLSALIYWANERSLLQAKAELLKNSVTQVLNFYSEASEGDTESIENSDLIKEVSRGVFIQVSSKDAKNVRMISGIALPVEQNTSLQLRRVSGREVYYLARPINAQGKTFGYLQAAIDLQDVMSAQATLLRQLLLLSISAVILAALGGVILSHQVLGPLNKLNKEIADMSVQDLNRRLNVRENGDELDALIGNFNKMLDRLERAFIQQKQFVSNASHELRTPLMVIGGHADILQRWGAEKPNVVRDSARSINEEVRLMTKLVEDLLTLAKEDLGLNLTGLDLSELVLQSASGLPFLQGYQVVFDVISNVTVKGDALYLKQLVRIILENAGKYVPPKSTIKISLSKNQAGAYLCIEDNGPGIEQEALKDIFLRFYRVDEARSRSNQGYGLGLSIAKMIVEQHGGTIWAENVAPHGAKFCISLPNN